MDKFIKTNIIFFSLLSFISTIFLFLGSEKILLPFIIVFVFNLSLLILLLLLSNKIIKINRMFFMNLLFWLVLSSFAYWYLISSLLNQFYGSYLTLNGLYFFMATRDYFTKLLIYVGSAFFILFFSLILARITREKTDKTTRKNIKRLEKESVKEIKKIDKTFFIDKIKFGGIIIIIIIILYLLTFFLPDSSLKNTTPLIDLIQNLNQEIEQNYEFNNSTIPILEGKKIFNFSYTNTSVIVIMLESVSKDRIHYYGYWRNNTPNIDKFAKDSIVFNNSFSTASHSDYAQPSFLSGRYTLIGDYRNSFDLNYTRNFLWDSLKNKNYSTAYISSQNDYWANMIDYYNLENLDFYSHSVTDGEYDYGFGNTKKDYDESTINKSINWINTSSKPLFLYLNLQATHYPYEYPEGNSIFKPDNVSIYTTYFNIPKEDYNNSVNDYDNSLYYVDKQVGKLLDNLKRNNLYNNSIIILTSDHGESLEINHNHLRHGYGVYREEILVPLIIKFPQQEHRIINQKVRHIDVIPTILDILNLSIPSSMQGKPMKENVEIFMFAQNQNFKIGLVKNNIKYIIDMNDYNLEAYNLTADPYEKVNLENKEELKFKNYRDRLLDIYNCQKQYYFEENWEKRIDCI